MKKATTHQISGTRTHRMTLNVLIVVVCVAMAGFMSSCDDNDPVKEDTPELITKATLTFTPAGGGTVVTATATDPDGEGVQDIEMDGPIVLKPNTSYALSISLINELAKPTDEEYDIAAEVKEEGDEHMFFFSWTNDAFSDPAGNGNVDNRNDAVNYDDEDDNGLPVGLETSWTTGAASTGKFRVMLKHQPDLKSGTSTSSTGESDLDVEFDLEIE